jgi:hypothetical protein
MAGEAKTLIGLSVLGVGGYYLGSILGWWGGSAAAPSTTPAAPATPAPSTPAAVLTAADAATFPYSSAITADQMNSISATINQQIQAGQIPTIAGGSVLAYMLGWGGLPSGTSKTVSGETYLFDGSNWNLQPAATGTTSTTSSTSSTAVTPQKLSYALNLWAVAHGYAQQMNMSQWNYGLNAINQGGAPPVMTDPYNGGIMTAMQYVAALTADPKYKSNLPSISKNFGLSGYGMGHRVMTRAHRINYVLKPRYA